MTRNRFDTLAILFAARTSRRSLLLVAAAALLPIPVAYRTRAQDAAEATPQPPIDPTTEPTTLPTFEPETPEPTPTAPEPTPTATAEPPAPSAVPEETATPQPRPVALPRLSLSARSGKPGDEIDITLTGFVANERISILWFDNNRSKTLAIATATADGRLATKFPIPRTFAGSHRLRAIGRKGSRVESSFLVKRALTASPRSAIIDSDVVARATGFTAGTEVVLRWFAGADSASPSIEIGRTTTSSSGSGRIAFTIPESAPGPHRLEMRESSGGGKAIARVTVKCASETISCAGRCIDPATDHAHCGACGVACDPDSTCIEGVCLAPPAVPEGITVVATDPETIEVAWSPVSGASVRVATGDGLALTTVDSGTTRFLDTHPVPAQEHCYRLQAFNAAGDSSWSDAACATPEPICRIDTECPDDTCAVGICDRGACGLAAAACSVRPLVVIPSDVTGLPSDDVILARMSAAMEKVAAFFRTNAELALRYEAPRIVRTARDSLWMSTPYAAAEAGITPWDQPGVSIASGLPGTDPNQLLTLLEEAGYPPRSSGAVVLAVVASTLGGGSVGGMRLGPILRTTPDGGPDAGPAASGFGFAGQWVLDTILTGDDSASCQMEMGPGAWQCPANTSWGTLIHELGHGIGLPHSCEGWYRDGWAIPFDTCQHLVMQAHYSYPAVGLDPREIALLRLTKVFA